LDFLVDELGLDKSRFTITIFKGEGNIQKDEEASQFWQKYGITLDKIKI
jgi:alanyl-tRNA synthetase